MADSVTELARARDFYAVQKWADAHRLLAAADLSAALSGADLELFATSAYMLGREADYLALLERAHAAHLEAGDPGRAVRCAFWIGTHLAQRGEIAQAGGWLGRAHRLFARHDLDELERGYLLLPDVFESLGAGRPRDAARLAHEAVAIAERADDSELFALAAHMEGHIKVELGALDDGLALLDEAMLPAAAGELSPIVTGIVYCGVILACQDAREVTRAREWTGVLSRWCDSQPDLVAFTGRCRIHRAEIMQLGGSWSEALDEARRAHERCLAGQNESAAGEASYRQAEIHRLRGEHTAAERAYREASSRGREPQPGLALLRLAQGAGDAAVASIRRALAEAAQRSGREALVPACVEIMLAAGRPEEARAALGELERSTGDDTRQAPVATLAQAQGAVALADGDPTAALSALRRAARSWGSLDAPYEVARARELAGLACRELGDHEGAALELEAARLTYAELRAAPDLVRLDGLEAGAEPGQPHGLTPRELEVLRMIAEGRTNKAIASELVLSVRTVDRHAGNIFAKLGVSSRSAATSYAHEHQLL